MQTLFKVFIECVTTLLLLFMFSFGLEAHVVIAPQSGIEPTPSAMEAKSEPLDCPGSLSINLSDEWCCFLRILRSENSAQDVIIMQKTRKEYFRDIPQQQLELHMEQQTGSKQEKEYVKAVYCHPAYLTYMQSTS